MNPAPEVTKAERIIRMRTKLYFNGKKTTKASVVSMIGKELFEKFLAESKKVHRDDPNVDNSYWLGNGILTIDFDDGLN